MVFRQKQHMLYFLQEKRRILYKRKQLRTSNGNSNIQIVHFKPVQVKINHDDKLHQTTEAVL